MMTAGTPALQTLLGIELGQKDPVTHGMSVLFVTQGLASRGAALPEGELAALMAMADVDGSRELDYTEFVAATMHACKVQHEQLLIEAFQVRRLLRYGWEMT